MAEDLPFDFPPNMAQQWVEYGPSGDWKRLGASYYGLPPTLNDVVRQTIQGQQPVAPLGRLLERRGTDEQMVNDLMSIDPLMMLPKGLGNIMRMLGVLPQLPLERRPEGPQRLEM